MISIFVLKTLENTKKNALKICTLIGRDNIPIFSGSDKPLKYDLVTAAHVHGKSGLDIEGTSIEITKDYKIQLYYRRQKKSELAWGDTEHHRELVAQQLGI